MALPDIKGIIAALRSDDETRSLSRRAFFNLASFVTAAIGFTWLAERARQMRIS